jgi:type I restriction enzyme S subunit
LNFPSIKATTGIQNLDLYSYLQNPIPVPPRTEQDEIVSYINTQSEKINHFIQSKQHFITLLKEQRQNIIDEALISNSKKVRLKYCASKIGSGLTPKGGATVYQTSGVIFLRSQNIHNTALRLDDVAYITAKIHSEMASSQVRKGDVLLNITGASIGRCFWFNSDEEANVNQHVSIIRPNPEILNSEFLMYQLQSSRIQNLINTVQGASREGLTIHEIKNYLLFVPTVTEQKKIVSYIINETKTLDIAIGKAEREIELMKEYREAMIAEAVTGKMIICL